LRFWIDLVFVRAQGENAIQENHTFSGRRFPGCGRQPDLQKKALQREGDPPHFRKRESLVYLALERLAKTSGGRVSASEAFFFIWVVERVCKRHNIDFPSLNFKVKQGMLISANLIYILRKLIKEESLKLEGDYLIPVKPPIKGLPEAARDLRRKIAGVIEETAAQWSMDIPNEQLVRFAQLFK